MREDGLKYGLPIIELATANGGGDVRRSLVEGVNRGLQRGKSRTPGHRVIRWRRLVLCGGLSGCVLGFRLRGVGVVGRLSGPHGNQLRGRGVRVPSGSVRI